MFRFILEELESWRNEKSRKVLLIRGARQVGKTYIVRKLAENFNNYIEVNFEENREIHSIFQDNLNPDIISQNLSVYYGTSISDEKTLLFFDEIQACPDALMSLRYFYEKRPGLHVIATGSLLDFAFRDLPSFGVGRIRSLFMYPMSFNEFLLAAGEEKLLQVKEKASVVKPLNDSLHKKLINHLKKFLLVGGMPEVVQSYVDEKDVSKCQKLLNDILISIQTDFPKYKQRVPSIRLYDVFKSVAFQSGNKFMPAHIGQGYSHRQVKNSLELLTLSGLVYPIYHSSSRGLPLGAGKNFKKYKMLFFDTGIFQRILGLKISDFILSNDFNVVNKGNIAEIFAGVEMIKAMSPYEKPEIYYWHREAKSSNAEVDYVIQVDNTISPIEIKAGTKGQMQSLHLFIKERSLHHGYRCSLENFSQYSQINVIPLYAIPNLFKES